MEKDKEMQPLQWHPAFYAGIQIELAHVRQQVHLENEHQLGTKPKEIDVLIVKKDSEEVIDNNIGRMFRKHNLVEYKSPEDYFSIDDFYKVYGYACFYKSDTEHVGQIKAEEITITFVCSRFPRKMLRYLQRKRGYEIVRQEAGIYYIIGDVFPMQIIVLPQLSEKRNFWLRHLTNNIKDTETARKLLTEYQKHKGNKLYEALMDIIVRANWKIFSEVRGMCKALEELMKDELDAREAKGIEQGIKSVIEVCKDLGVSWDASIAMLVEKFQLTQDDTERYMKIYW